MDSGQPPLSTSPVPGIAQATHIPLDCSTLICVHFIDKMLLNYFSSAFSWSMPDFEQLGLTFALVHSSLYSAQCIYSASASPASLLPVLKQLPPTLPPPTPSVLLLVFVLVTVFKKGFHCVALVVQELTL